MARRYWLTGIGIGFALLGLLAFIGLENYWRTTPTSEIKVSLPWFHNSEFAGFYLADQNGNYANEGLDVSFSEGGPTVDTLDAVIKGEAQFGVSSAAEVITARAEGNPVRAVAVLYRRSPLVFVSLKDSGITRPDQFAGKRIWVSEQSEPLVRAVAQRVGLAPDDYEVTRDKSLDFGELDTGNVDVWVGYVFDEAEAIRNTGNEINLIFPDNYGVHFYGNTIVTTDQFIEEHPDTVLAFLRATLKEGWQKAVSDPDAAGASVKKYVVDSDPKDETAFLLKSIPYIDTGKDHIGWMKPDIWTNMVDSLERFDVLKTHIDPKTVYMADFLEEIYGND